MSVEHGTTWEAPKHTVAKIEMVRKYLRVWLRILGVSFRGMDLWYLDGFAGPGEYSNYPDGSPVAALKAAREAMDGGGWVAGSVRCVFMEDDKSRFANLETVLASIPQSKNIHRYPLFTTFVDGMSALRADTPNPFTPPCPLFAFIDPFGVKGLPFALIRGLLSSPRCEVLVNLDSDGIKRVHAAGKFANHRVRLNEIFGDENWETELSKAPSNTIAQTIVAMYKRRLKTISNVKYVFAFEMRSKNRTIDYHLVFATQHPRGLEKMKEVMRQFSQNGTYVFSDASDSRQVNLFRFDDPAHHAKELADKYRGREVPYNELSEYVLNESPFVNPKKMLRALESAGQIAVFGGKPTRRTGQYPDAYHQSMIIKFAD